MPKMAHSNNVVYHPLSWRIPLLSYARNYHITTLLVIIRHGPSINSVLEIFLCSC